jgi:hypothetical protein
MKPAQPLVGPALPSMPPATGAEGAAPRHPAAVEFARGVEVTEVVDSMPGELLELFAALTPERGR